MSVFEARALANRIIEAMDKMFRKLDFLIHHLRSIAENREHWISLVARSENDREAVLFVFRQFFEMIIEPLEETERELEKLYREAIT